MRVADGGPVLQWISPLPSDMLPNFLFPETTVESSGSGEACAVGGGNGLLLLTLGIGEVVEQESLDIRIMGSADGEQWLEKPLRSFPQKFYQGVSQILLDLSASPEVKYLRVDYLTARWGVGFKTPKFKFYVFAEPFSEAKSA